MRDVVIGGSNSPHWERCGQEGNGVRRAQCLRPGEPAARRIPSGAGPEWDELTGYSTTGQAAGSALTLSSVCCGPFRFRLD